MKRMLYFFLLIFLFPPPPVFSLEQPLENRISEERAQLLFSSLRCITCAHQNISDSHTQIAQDMRLLIRNKIAAGETDKEILDFFVARYGEFILLRPRINTNNALLWGTPFFIFLGGFFYLLRYIFKLRRKI